jgi:hypothetical protein
MDRPSTNRPVDEKVRKLLERSADSKERSGELEDSNSDLRSSTM